LYSHDTQGLGHVRRNIELASALVARDPATDVLLITGAAETASLPLPPNTDLVVLPAVTKSSTGSYAASDLQLPFADLLGLRADLIAAAVAGFSPDLLVVDKEARGLHGELDKTLAIAPTIIGAAGHRMKVVLGLREVLDAPERCRLEWREARTTETVITSYDQVWIYGDRTVHDLTRVCRLPETVRDLVRFTGYLAHGRGSGVRPRVSCHRSEPVPDGPYVLCLVGGGQDGASLARAFVGADLPRGHHGVLVTGPYMGSSVRTELAQAAAARADLTVHDFLSSTLGLIDRAAAVVAMGGYNTVCELLASGRPGLIVPRVRPRLEQAIRADGLARRTHLDALAPEGADARALTRWLAGAALRPALPHALDLDGLTVVPQLAADLLSESDVADPATRVVCDATA